MYCSVSYGRCRTGSTKDIPKALNTYMNRNIISYRLNRWTTAFLKMFLNARFMFALETMKKYMSIGMEKGFIFSPHLIYQNLLAIYLVTSGNTEASLRRVLCIPNDISKDEIKFLCDFKKEVFHHMISKSKENKDHYNCIINSTFFITDSKQPDDDMLDLLSSCGKIKSVDISAVNIRDFINNYMNCVTQRDFKNKLDMLSPGSITEDTDIVLAKALHLKGIFDFISDKDTKPENATDEFETFKTKNHGKSNELHAYIMEAPYKERVITMFFLFPLTCLDEIELDTTENGITQLINRLTTEEGSQELCKLLNDGMPPQPFDKKIPILKIEQDLKMEELLVMLDLKGLTPCGISSASHDFTSMTHTKGSVYKLGNAMHQARINTTNNGVIVSANDTLITMNTSHSVNIEQSNISVDDSFPFIYLIYDRNYHSILFSGVLLKNEEKSTATHTDTSCNDGDKA